MTKKKKSKKIISIISILLLLFIGTCVMKPHYFYGITKHFKKMTFEESDFKKEVNFSDTETGILCYGEYVGYEFSNQGDIGHQFSNDICGKVGDKLKGLYDSGIYSKVDFENITMSTEGMGSGTVKYIVIIPISTVDEKCAAYTSFDHVGGWNHTPSLQARKAELQKALMQGDTLNVSSLKTTPEGLQEYWIQWRNKKKQANCIK